MWQGVPRVRSGRPSRGFRLGPGVPVPPAACLAPCASAACAFLLASWGHGPLVLACWFVAFLPGRGAVGESRMRSRGPAQGSRRGLRAARAPPADVSGSA